MACFLDVIQNWLGKATMHYVFQAIPSDPVGTERQEVGMIGLEKVHTDPKEAERPSPYSQIS